MDDNVHMQNTLQMAWKLQKAGKPFEMMLYPKSRHGVTDPDLSLHLRRDDGAVHPEDDRSPEVGVPRPNSLATPPTPIRSIPPFGQARACQLAAAREGVVPGAA